MARCLYVPVIAMVLATGAMVAPAGAQGLTKEQVRTRILDSCVYSEWPKRQESGGVVELCVCTAKAMISEMSDEEVARYDPGRRMSRTLRARYGAALEACA